MRSTRTLDIPGPDRRHRDSQGPLRPGPSHGQESWTRWCPPTRVRMSETSTQGRNRITVAVEFHGAGPSPERRRGVTDGRDAVARARGSGVSSDSARPTGGTQGCDTHGDRGPTRAAGEVGGVTVDGPCSLPLSYTPTSIPGTLYVVSVREEDPWTVAGRGEE